jgi:hypothetical protein
MSLILYSFQTAFVLNYSWAHSGLWTIVKYVSLAGVKRPGVDGF